MIHLVQHANKTFEVVTVENGKMIVNSNPQQYNKRNGCYTNMRSQAKNFPGATGVIFQDDTKEGKPVVYFLPLKGAPVVRTDIKAKKPYVMAKKK